MKIIPMRSTCHVLWNIYCPRRRAQTRYVVAIIAKVDKVTALDIPCSISSAVPLPFQFHLPPPSNYQKPPWSVDIIPG